MGKKQEFWDVSVSPEQEKDIDIELFNELNNKYTESTEKFRNKSHTKTKKMSSNLKKAFGLLIVVFFIIFITNSWLKVFLSPDLNFLNISSELKKNSYYDDLQEAVVSISCDNNNGTGFNINSNGLIITNNHIINNSQKAKVSFKNGEFFIGDVIKSFSDIDLALINVKGNNLPIVKLEEEVNYNKEEEMTIIGNPLGYNHVIQKGTIIGLVELNGWDKPVIMIEGYIHPGNSGSPVFNSYGNVEAVIFAVLNTKSDKSEKITGLAIPIKYLIDRL